MIQVHQLHKSFRLYRRPLDRLLESLGGPPRHHLHQALVNVSFSVPPGSTVGIIGHNGAGKSTLLKLLTGVLLPDSGNIQTGGRITGLLELGTGFNPELTGRANIHHNGLLIGIPPEELETLLQPIIAFSELGRFIDEPLKTYSSGMVMRLAFSIAIHARPDTFLVDEALAVGDAHFQQKCFRRIREFRQAGGSIVLVSHDLNAIKLLCDQVLLLDHGRVVEFGQPEAVVNAYNYLVARQGEDQPHDRDLLEKTTPYGNQTATIESVEIRGAQSGTQTVSSGEETIIRLGVVIREEVPELTAGILLRDRFGQDIFGTNTHHLGIELPNQKGHLEVEFQMAMNIAPGSYTLTVALHSQDNHSQDCYHWHDQAATLTVAGVLGPLYAGVCRLQPALRLRSASPSRIG